MTIVNLIITNKSLTSSVCFVGGYALISASLAINQLAVKYLGLPIDIKNGQEYSEYTDNIMKATKQFAFLNDIGLDRQLGINLSDSTALAIREEISYRFLLETIVLPYIRPQFAVFSIARTCVSSLLFAARHLHSDHPTGALTGQFFNTALLGIVCSLAQQRMGLVGSIFVHVGYNLHAWQWLHNQNLADVVKKIKAVRLMDVIHPVKIGEYLFFLLRMHFLPLFWPIKALRK